MISHDVYPNDARKGMMAMNATRELHIEIVRRGDCHILKLIGALHVDTIGKFRDRIDMVRRRPVPKVIIDCTDLEYADERAGHIFVEYKDKLFRSGGVFLMAAMSARTQATLRSNGFEQELGLCPTVEKALRLLQESSDTEREVDVF